MSGATEYIRESDAVGSQVDSGRADQREGSMTVSGRIEPDRAK